MEVAKYIPPAFEKFSEGVFGFGDREVNSAVIRREGKKVERIVNLFKSRPEMFEVTEFQEDGLPIAMYSPGIERDAVYGEIEFFQLSTEANRESVKFLIYENSGVYCKKDNGSTVIVPNEIAVSFMKKLADVRNQATKDLNAKFGVNN